MKELRELIRNVKLTKSEDTLSNFLLEHLTDFCFMNITDTAKKSGVSEATIVRFTKKLGFDGFIDFQKYIRAYFQSESRQVNTQIVVPTQRLLDSQKDTHLDYILQNASITQKNMETALANNPLSVYEAAIEIILGSSNKYILGSRANRGMASDCYIIMKRIVSGVFSVANATASVIDNLSDISDRDCLIAFSFPRYSKLDLAAVRMAYDSGAKIIVITDKASSPAAVMADAVFTVSVDSNDFFNSFTGAYFIIETLCSGLNRRIGTKNKDKLDKIDHYLFDLDMY